MQNWQDSVKDLPVACQEAARAHFLRAEAAREKAEQLHNGSFWTPLEELYKPSPALFQNGYKAICLRMTNEEWKRPQDYQQIVNDFKAQAQESNVVDDISLHSVSTESAVYPPDCLGGVIGYKGHLIPVPRYGIITQPVIGFSFEDFIKSKIEQG